MVPQPKRVEQPSRPTWHDLSEADFPSLPSLRKSKEPAKQSQTSESGQGVNPGTPSSNRLGPWTLDGAASPLSTACCDC